VRRGHPGAAAVRPGLRADRHPLDLRRTVGLADDVAIRIMPARTGAAPDQSDDLWELARATAAQLADALQMATWQRRPSTATVVHSDRGSQDVYWVGSGGRRKAPR